MKISAGGAAGPPPAGLPCPGRRAERRRAIPRLPAKPCRHRAALCAHAGPAGLAGHAGRLGRGAPAGHDGPAARGGGGVARGPGLPDAGVAMAAALACPGDRVARTAGASRVLARAVLQFLPARRRGGRRGAFRLALARASGPQGRRRGQPRGRPAARARRAFRARRAGARAAPGDGGRRRGIAGAAGREPRRVRPVAGRRMDGGPHALVGTVDRTCARRRPRRGAARRGRRPRPAACAPGRRHRLERGGVAGGFRFGLAAGPRSGADGRAVGDVRGRRRRLRGRGAAGECRRARRARGHAGRCAGPARHRRRAGG